MTKKKTRALPKKAKTHAPLPTVWQVGAGDRSRSYVDFFTRYDLMCIGGTPRFKPGSKPSPAQLQTAHAVAKRFIHVPKPGDLVLLRSGTELQGVGVIPQKSGYRLREDFDDIHGWQLPHSRRVLWQGLPVDLLDTLEHGPDRFFGNARQMSRFSKVLDSKRLQRLEPHLNDIRSGTARSLRRDAPELPAPLTNAELGHMLYDRGLGFDAATRLIDMIENVRRIGKWYRTSDASGDRPNEHEIVAYMVLPLLSALGWSQQRIAIEWQNIDLAGFDRTPTVNETCALVCEAKLPAQGLGPALGQAYRYIDKLGLQSCRAVLVTDGLIYYLYRGGNAEEPGEGEWVHQGYVNLDRVRTRHHSPHGIDGVETILNMTPERIGQF